jgi:hypothetical protein
MEVVWGLYIKHVEDGDRDAEILQVQVEKKSDNVKDLESGASPKTLCQHMAQICFYFDAGGS